MCAILDSVGRLLYYAAAVATRSLSSYHTVHLSILWIRLFSKDIYFFLWLFTAPMDQMYSGRPKRVNLATKQVGEQLQKLQPARAYHRTL